MFFYMTSGTPEFMEKMFADKRDVGLYLLHGQGNSILFYETDKKKSIFATPRKFEVIDGRGRFEQRGYFAIENIPVADEERYVFEEAVVKTVSALHGDLACIAFRVLRPVKSETFLIVTQWAGPVSYEKWKAGASAFTELVGGATSTTQTMFTSKAYVSTFSAPPDEK
ncbi:MAG: Target of RNAIII-activating protein [Lysinibacillus sp.]